MAGALCPPLSRTRQYPSRKSVSLRNRHQRRQSPASRSSRSQGLRDAFSNRWKEASPSRHTSDNTQTYIIEHQIGPEIARQKSNGSQTSTHNGHLSTAICIGEDRGDRAYRFLSMKSSILSRALSLTCGEGHGWYDAKDSSHCSSTCTQRLHHRVQEHITHRIRDSNMTNAFSFVLARARELTRP